MTPTPFTAAASPRIPAVVIVAVIAFWLLSAITSVASFYFDPDLAEFRSEWNVVLLKRTLLSLYWIAISFFALAWFRDRLVSVRSAALVAIGGTFVVFGFMAYKGVVITFVSGGQRSWWTVFSEDLSLEFVYQYFHVWEIAIAANAYYYYQRLTQNELRLAKTELMLFRAQLEPHFLFNTLNSIASLVRLKRHEEAIDAIQQLSTLLRHVLDIGQDQLVPFSWEQEFTRLYVALQELRFGDKLRVHFRADEMPGGTPFPVMMLQPLVENAINHGPLSDAEACEVDLDVRRSEHGVKVEVRNKVGRTHAKDRSGLGLKNIASRLSVLYGSNYRFSYEQDGADFVVEVELPV